MKNIRSKRKNRTLVQIFFSIVVAISVTIVVLSSILYLNFESIAVSLLTSSAKESLSQVSYSATFMNTSAGDMIKQLYSDLNVQYLLHNNGPAHPQLTLSLNQLNAYKSSSGFVDSIYIYNRNTDTVYSTLNYGECRKEDFMDQTVFSYLNQPEQYNMKSPIFRTVYSDSKQQSPKGVFTFILNETLSPSAGSSAIILNLSANWMQNVIFSMEQGNAVSGNILMVNSKSQVIDLASMALYAGEGAIVDQVLASGEESGAILTDVDGVHSLVTSVYDGETGWYFVRITPYNDVIGRVNRMRTLTLLVSGAILACGLLLSAILSRRLYRPYHFMDSKVKQLEAENRNQAYLVGQEYRRKAIRGEIGFTESQWRQGSVGSASLGDAPVRLILIKTDDYQSFCLTQSTSERILLYRDLWKMAGPCFAPECRVEPVPIDDLHSILVAAGEELSLPGLKTALQRLQQAARGLPFSFSCAISEEGDARHDLPILYRQCLETIDYRMFYGTGCILAYEEVLPAVEPPCAYPQKEENLLIEALAHGNLEQAKQVYNHMMEPIRRCPFHTFRLMTLKLLASLNIAAESLEVEADANGCGASFRQILSPAETFETLEETDRYFFTLFSVIVEHVTVKSSTRKAEKHAALAGEIIEEIERNYQDKNLSLDVLAEKWSMSPVYLGRIFKKDQGHSVADTINRVRLEKAKTLLLATQLPIVDIADQAGFSGSNYFYAVFKKAVGVTPSVYRQCNGCISQQNERN